MDMSYSEASKEAITLQERQIFIFASQLLCALPSHMVPLMNQQSFPALNSQAGQSRLLSTGHFMATQQSSRPFLSPFNESKSRIWLSA
jgi:hypothetical protein